MITNFIITGGNTEIPTNKFLTLPKKIRKGGFEYKQWLDGSKAFIYEQHGNGDKVYFEVFKKRVSPERTFKGKTFPKSLRFPNDEAFGKWAWSYGSFEDAMKKFNELEGFNKPDDSEK